MYKRQGFEGVDVSHGFMGNNPALQIQEMFCRHEGPVESTIEYFVAQETNRLIEKARDKDQPFFSWDVPVYPPAGTWNSRVPVQCSDSVSYTHLTGHADFWEYQVTSSPKVRLIKPLSTLRKE